MALDKKMVLVGDDGIGKTSLVMKFCDVTYEIGREPWLYEQAMKDVKIDDTVVRMSVRDTPGSDDYERLRPFVYPDTDVFLFCYALDDPDSLQNLALKWKPEIEQFANPGIPIILLGTKLDLSTYVGKMSVRKEQVRKVAKDLKAVSQYQCSTRTNENVQEVWDAAVQVALQPEGHVSSKSCCVIV